MMNTVELISNVRMIRLTGSVGFARYQAELFYFLKIKINLPINWIVLKKIWFFFLNQS